MQGSGSSAYLPARGPEMKDQGESRHYHPCTVSRQQEDLLILPSPGPLYKNLIGREMNVVLRRSPDHRLAQIRIRGLCRKPDTRAAHRCDISKVIPQLVVIQLAGSQLPPGAYHDCKPDQTENDLDFSHEENLPSPLGSNANCQVPIAGSLHPAVSAGRCEMKCEGIARQTHRNAVIYRNEHRRRARRPDPLD